MGWYDQMQVCTNGHLITDRARSYPQHRADYCKLCGAKTIDCCLSCGAQIKGCYENDSDLVFVVAAEVPAPAYCDACGAAYPWQVAAIENLTEIVREGELSAEDVAEIEAALPDVLRETPKTQSASLKLGRLLRKLGKPTYEIAMKVVTDIASETAKKTMGL